MSSPDYTLYRGTPAVAVQDNRGLIVREIAYHRHPDQSGETDTRITRYQFSARGFLTQSIDPRLYALQQSNSSVKASFSYLSALSGEVLKTSSVDAGDQLALADINDRPHLAVSAGGVVRSWQYEGNTLPGRLLSITEQPAGAAALITERFVWAGKTDDEKKYNLAGKCVRHYDTAGLEQVTSIALSGTPLSVTRQLLPDNKEADWQGADESAWKDLLAAESYTSRNTTDASGAPLTSNDARGNIQRLEYDVAGRLSGSWLKLKGDNEQAIVKSLSWSAAGQKLREEHANGVVTTWSYDPQNQWLAAIKTERPAGHRAGAKVLQDLHYAYDPVGNVLQVTNAAEATRFWRNQKVVAENSYRYDTLYQLVTATGREMADRGQQSFPLPAAKIPLPVNDNAFAAWTRGYTYDRGGNLAQIRHHAPASSNSYTTTLTVASRSNRAVLSTLTEDAAKVDALFSAGGQQKQLQPGQSLSWTLRDELRKVTPVSRDGQASDSEVYRYDAGSLRLVKTTTRLTGNSSNTRRVVYLPGLELHTLKSGDTLKENLQVITVGEAGRAQVRVLNWESGLPAGITDNQLRYSYDNLLGSSELELDGDGQIISLEEYYPYGGTAVWTARSKVEADYKTLRYSGKERDATGLYYFGYRYYQPWVGRWLSADPASALDGLNLFRMVRNSPVTWFDGDGLIPVTVNDGTEKQGYLYSPLRSSDMVTQALGVNLTRYNKGKSLYPVIVTDTNALLEFEKNTLSEMFSLNERISELRKPIQNIESKLRQFDLLTQERLIEFVTPKIYSETMQQIDRLSNQRNVLSKMKVISNNAGKALRKLLSEKDKLYILGHGLSGMDFLGADENLTHGLITSESLAMQLTAGHLPSDFKDIRVIACYSANATAPISFTEEELLRTTTVFKERTVGWRSLFGLLTTETAPFALSLSRALKRKGYSQVTVTGYSGAGVTFSQHQYQTRRIQGVANDQRSSDKTVRLKF
ncbi:RHS repeat-associated protein [Erwinia toletana]|uniref:RHS repeat-associated protein n=1 Tax=Winslowiella toletana TaxID=92490 RepID=A0ABS4PE44_9GAMM|nr:RHS repeat domain-containing protein [Winslowiella toletana]MBP2170904.1 RHS repeat-associated protein [Winslowiella toletana]